VARRRLGRSTVIAGAALLCASLAASALAVRAQGDPAAPAWRLVVLDVGGVQVATAELADGRFALRYRNSVYGSLAEERFAVASDGRIVLVGLAADERAVLGEYYAARNPSPADNRGALRWEAAPHQTVVLRDLTIAATDLGARTLVIDGRAPIALWRLVGDRAPGLTLRAEPIP
jgi:hypothetical protein